MSKLKEWWTSTIGHFEMTEDRAGKILLAIVLVMLVVFLFIGVRTCEQKNNEQKSLIQSVQAMKDTIHHFKDQNGVLHNRVQSLVLYSNQMKDVGEALGFKVDSMKRVIKDLNGLVYYYKGQIKDEGHFMFAMEDGGTDTATFKTVPGLIKSGDKFPEGTTFTTTPGKTIGFSPAFVRRFNYSTKYLHLEGTYSPATDSVKGNYLWKSEFQLFVYDKKQGWFKPTLTYADIVLTDPNASLINGKSLLITQKKKWYDSRGVHIIEGAILGGIGVYGASLIFK